MGQVIEDKDGFVKFPIDKKNNKYLGAILSEYTYLYLFMMFS